MDKKQEPLASLRERFTRYMEERAMRKTPERYEILRAAGLANGIFTIDGLMKIMQEDGTFDLLPKKEVIKLNLEREKLEKFMGGITEMKKMPAAMFIVDPRKERIAVLEAKKLGIPIVAIVDTNCDPDEIDAVIPGNDDAIRAIKLISSVLADAVIEGNQGEQNAAAEESAVVVEATSDIEAAKTDAE